MLKHDRSASIGVSGINLASLTCVTSVVCEFQHERSPKLFHPVLTELYICELRQLTSL
jgi:hypothetical protein